MSAIELLGALEFGLIFSLCALAIFITFRILDFPDLTVDGSFVLGAGVSLALVSKGCDPWLALVVATVCGALSGVATGLIATRLQIASLLASIIVLTGLYSVNLHVMGAPNITLFDQRTIFSAFENFSNVDSTLQNVIFYLAVVAIVLSGYVVLFKTNLGLSLKATGDNPVFAKSIGISTSTMVVLGVAISNGLVALCAAIYAQSQMIADINMGVGTIIAGLGAVIIGECVLNSRSMLVRSILVIVGAIVYRVVITVGISLSSVHDGFGLSTDDLNLITAALVLVFIYVAKKREKSFARI